MDLDIRGYVIRLDTCCATVFLSGPEEPSEEARVLFTLAAMMEKYGRLVTTRDVVDSELKRSLHNHGNKYLNSKPHYELDGL
jgi:hypothetical protein